MSLFDFPRINIKGLLELTPGTANNDDYAGAVSLPSNWGPFAGQTLALIDSKLVQANTYGMTDAQFIAWVQKRQPFVSSSNACQTKEIIPAEWNYYGDMGSKVLSATVVGVQTAPDQEPLTSLLGATFAYSGGITDVNSEGSPPATQFFIDRMTLTSGSASPLKGAPLKGACQWLNFYRNINLTQDGGAGGYVYHVMYRDHPGNVIDIPGFDAPDVAGIIFRYYLYRPMQTITGNDALEKLYEQKGMNSSQIEFIATIAPLFANEKFTAAPAGRLMIANTPSIPTPAGTQNNGGGMIALAPAVLQQFGDRISADFSGTFPDYYKTSSNDKYDFGPVDLVVDGSGVTATVGNVPYADTASGDAAGWIFDFDISQNADAQKALADTNASFRLVSATWGTVLAETEFYFVTNEQAIYAEQHGAGDTFINQGTETRATLGVFSRGKLLSPEECQPVTVWQYRSVPMQDPGNATVLTSSYKPGEPIVVDTSQPGNFALTFTAGGVPPANYPPKSYGTFMNPPWVTNAPAISLRILPNDEDFSQYYVYPIGKEPVGNRALTFDVVYTKVLRTYYLLYPAMNKIIDLSSEEAVRPFAQQILDATDMKLWLTTHYMPRTRDMSQSRRTLLRAWCHKVLKK